MEILKEYGINGDKRMRYNLLEAPGTNLNEMIGQRLNIKAYLLVYDTNPETGEPRKSLKVITDDGEIIGTRSISFISGFERFLACMETDECTEFEVGQARSKAGRNYLTFRA